jgi:hypothetical protein
MVKSWGKWTLWQFTDKAPGNEFGVKSAKVDLDFYNGTIDNFNAEYGFSSEPPCTPINLEVVAGLEEMKILIDVLISKLKS